MSETQLETQAINFEDFELDKIHMLGVPEDKSLEQHLELEKTELDETKAKLEIKDDGTDQFAEAAKLKAAEDAKKAELETKQKDKDDEPEPEVEESETTTEELLPFYTALNKELGIEEELKTEELGEGIPGLLGYLKDIVSNTIDGERQEIMEMGNGLLGDLFTFLKNGGKPEKFIDTFFKQEDYSTVPIEGEDNVRNQRKVVEDLLKRQGEEDLDIQDKLKDYENAGILEKQAKSAVKQLVKYNEQDKVALVKQQEIAAKVAEDNRNAYWENVTNTIKNSEEIGGLPITKENKEKLVKHLTERGKDGLTTYERNLRSDKDRALKFAYVDMLNFDFTTLKTKAKTEAVKDVKKAIARFTDTGTKIASKAKNNDDETTKNNKVDFSAFRLPHLQ